MQEFKRFYNWSKGSEGGIFSIAFLKGTIWYKCVKGNAPLGDIPLYIILSNPEIAQYIERCAPREVKWRRQIYQGMSGCIDWYIQWYNEKHESLMRMKVWHESMYDKANEDLEFFAKDFFDTFADTECVSDVKKLWDEGLRDEVEITNTILFKIHDNTITVHRDEAYENKLNEFLEDVERNPPKEFRYSFDDHKFTETEADEEIVDYSNYSPSTGN